MIDTATDALVKRTFDFVSVLTAVVVLIYLCSATAALFIGKISWDVFQGQVGAPATLLLGYWVRGKVG